MASAKAPTAYVTIAEYLAREEDAITKSEYFAGEIFMMAGGSPNHNRISGNIFSELLFNTRGSSCEPFNSDQRIRLPSGLATYPDAMVVCGQIEYDNEDPHAITNPVLLVEVLSPSTSNYDRGEKFEFYREVKTFQEYLTIHQDKVYIEHWYKRDDDQWMLHELTKLDDSLILHSIDVSFSLQQIYERVEWDNEPRKLTHKNAR